MSEIFKKRWVIILSISLTGIFLWWLLREVNGSNDFSTRNMTPEIKQEEDQIREIEEYHEAAQEDWEKVQNFIIERVPNGVEFIHFSLTNESSDDTNKEADLSELMKVEVLQLFFLSLQEQDTFMLSGVMMPSAIQSVWTGVTDPDERIAAIELAVEKIGRNKTLESFSYRYDIDKYKVIQNTGLMTLNYDDGVSLDLPFELVYTDASEHGDEEHVVYFINTPLQEISNLIQQ